MFFFFKQKTAYEMRISDWSSDVCSSDLLRSLKAYAEMIGNKKVAAVNADDLCGGACAMLSLFIRDPQFQGQTKEKLVTVAATKLVETSIKDHFDHWLSGHPERARLLLERVLERADERQRRRQEKEQSRKTATRKLRLRSEEHTSELKSLMRTSYAVFCLKKKQKRTPNININSCTYHIPHHA